MSLLLKALRQAEQAHGGHARSGRDDDGSGLNDLALDPVDSEPAKPRREWVEPPGLDDPVATPRPAREWRWPLGLVPTTALLALLIAAGYGLYFYLMTRPQSWTPSASPPAPPPATAPASAPPAVRPPAPEPAAPAPAQAVTTAPAQATATPADLPRPARPAGASRPPRQPAASATPSTPAAAAPVAILSPAPQTNLLEQAYAAYQTGNLDAARALYQQSARSGPNPQALLGLAGISQARGDSAEAIRLYQAVLEISPGNAVAEAALLDMLGASDPAAAVARVKQMIAREPSGFLFFALGNLYADQGRWSDAELAYFEAYQREPKNADYAFNLAVSLDNLKQVDAAARYYDIALRHAGPATRFDRGQAAKRLDLLR
jgi:TolA-binding protein